MSKKKKKHKNEAFMLPDEEVRVEKPKTVRYISMEYVYGGRYSLAIDGETTEYSSFNEAMDAAEIVLQKKYGRYIYCMDAAKFGS